MSAVADQAADRWRATLCLNYACLDKRTIVRARHEGPLRVQKPFYPPDGACHTYVLHPPGGVVGGDRLRIDVDVQSAAAALVTTPAAMKVYRSTGATAELSNAIRVRSGAALEWLPQDTILFGGSRLRQATRVHLDAAARYCGWEVWSLGRPASGDRYASGTLDQCLEIFVDDNLRLRERLFWDDESHRFDVRWNLGRQRSGGSLVLFPASAGTLERVRLLLRRVAAEVIAATRIDDLIVVRALSSDAVILRESFAQIWSGIREHVFSRAACPPRIWAT